jgi:hypothetical protein
LNNIGATLQLGSRRRLGATSGAGCGVSGSADKFILDSSSWPLGFGPSQARIAASCASEECACQAKAVRDEKLRADYLRLEQGWLKLAGSYALYERPTLFSDEAARRKNDPN